MVLDQPLALEMDLGQLRVWANVGVPILPATTDSEQDRQPAKTVWV